MRRNAKSALIVLIVIITVAAASAIYIWNKPHRDVRDEESFAITAKALYDSFSTNEQRANTLYLNKALTVRGEIVQVKKNQAGYPVLILQSNDAVFGVNCTLKDSSEVVKAGDAVSVKGICTGYPGDVVLNQAILLK